MLKRLWRYGTVTFLSYIALTVGTYLAVELLNLKPTVAYPIILVLVYAGVYLASSSYVFKSNKHKKQSTRFIVTVVVFYFLNIGVYTIFIEVLSIQYLLAVILNLLILGPLRYFINSRFVFNNQETDS